MALHRDTTHRLAQILRLVSSVADLDPGIDQLRQRLKAFESGAGRTRAVELLAAAVAAGDTDPPLMFAAALAEQNATPAVTAEVIAGVRNRLHRRIRDLAADTGDATYRAVADQFSAAADKLTAADQVVDIEAPAEQVVDLPDRARKLWRQAPALAADLDRLAPALHAAAVLAGLAADTGDAEIHVCVDAAGVDPAVIAEAWSTPDRQAKAARAAANAGPFTGQAAPTRNRCGRWSALIRAGAQIRALHPDRDGAPAAM